MGKRRGRLPWLGTQTWDPHLQRETLHVYLPHLTGDVGVEVQ